MTDKEMAERYVKENSKVYYHPNGKPVFTREEDLKFAFIAGLKAGRPKWHKVADGDLPEDCEDGTNTSKHVWVQFKSGNTGVCYYDWDFSGWFANGYPEQIKDILAWCEIPKFGEGKNEN